MVDDRLPQLSSSKREEVARVIERWSDPSLAMALIGRESDWHPTMRMETGAYGLAQVLPSTFREHVSQMGWKGLRLEHPGDNVRVGLSYLGNLLSRYRDLRLALAAYNWGPGNVDRVGRRWTSVPADVRTYAQDIVRGRARYEQKKTPASCWSQRGYSQACYAMCGGGR